MKTNEEIDRSNDKIKMKHERTLKTKYEMNSNDEMKTNNRGS